MGPEQTAVQNRLHTPLWTLLIQLVGWQHWAGTQSESKVQVSIAGSAVGEGCTSVVVGGTVPPDGGWLAHPAAKVKVRATASNRRRRERTGGGVSMRADGAVRLI